MFLFKLIRKTAKILRGSVGTTQTILAVTLGMIAGFAFGPNLTCIGAALLLLFLNANLGLFLVSLGVGKGIAALAAPVTFRIGTFLLSIPPVESIVRTLVNAPVTALLGLEKYTILGGLPVAIALGIVLGLVTAKIIGNFQRTLAALDEKSEKWKKLNQNIVVRTFKWILFGKKPKKPEKPRLIRRGGVIAVVVGAVLFAVVGRFAMPPLMKAGVKYGMERFNRAEVNVEEVDVSLTKGTVRVRGLQMADAKNLDRNLVEFQEMNGKLSLSELLRKRVVLDEAVVTKARLDAKRKQRAYALPAPEEEVEEEVPPAPGNPLEKYLEKARDIKERLKQIKYYLERLQDLRERRERKSQEDLEKKAEKFGYSQLTADYLIEKQPRFLARLLAVREIAPLTDGMQPLSAEVRNISSDPALQKDPTTIDVEEANTGRKANIGLNYHTGKPHDLDLRLPNLSLAGLGKQMGRNAPVQFQQGTASLECKGTFSDRVMALPLKVVMKGMKAQAGEGGEENAMGMSPDLLAQALAAAEEISTTVLLSGRFSSPNVKIDASQLASSLKSALTKAGKDQLSRMLQDKAGGLLGGHEGAGKEVGDRLKGLLGGDSEKEDKEKEGEGEEKEKKPQDRLKDTLDLFN